MKFVRYFFLFVLYFILKRYQVIFAPESSFFSCCCIIASVMEIFFPSECFRVANHSSRMPSVLFRSSCRNKGGRSTTLRQFPSMWMRVFPAFHLLTTECLVCLNGLATERIGYSWEFRIQKKRFNNSQITTAMSDSWNASFYLLPRQTWIYLNNTDVRFNVRHENCIANVL